MPPKKPGPAKDEARKWLETETALLDALQQRFYADGGKALLVVFQAMDTGGKDGVIRRVFGPVNPQGVRVMSFKAPAKRELAQDYLWRVHAEAPAKGMIGVFNRSHYEDVLIGRVRRLASKADIEKRYGHINDFERLLADTGTVILKFFLHISKDEQLSRLRERLDNPAKRWKFEPADLEERKLWDEYMEAYGLALERCNAPHAPWHVIPADRKWYRDWAVARILRETLEALNPRFPEPKVDLEGMKAI